MAKQFKLPTIEAIWNKYYTYNASRIRELWFDRMAIFSMFANEPYPCPESVISWHYLMALTELLRMRGCWDSVNRCPKE